ncbi:unnamed protein product [Ranitomeya imitator]|uniref:Thyroglobulin type-1 domain-containing protein n=1 Tax=Ranitomeya imitator TaxID=111125 RepID=A0ABN9LNX5_9NEOB|nr:unnamed protein product [Ranitomeya imitator]
MEPLAERIRTSINITGIRVGQMEYRIGLYADDVILSCVNLETSLTAITLELREFSNVSYYRLNPTKSLLFPVVVPCAAKSKMEAELPFKWMTEGIPYLGVILTGSEQIVEKNFSKLITQNGEADAISLDSKDVYKASLDPFNLKPIMTEAYSESEHTPCMRHRQNVLGGKIMKIGAFVPKCDEKGNYVPKQCHGSTGYCWCLNENGEEIEGTRTPPGNPGLTCENKDKPPI